MQPRRTLLLVGLAAALAVGTFVAFAGSAYAQLTIDTGIGSTFGIGSSTDLRQTIVNIVQYALGLLGLIAVIIIMYGGFVWMTAHGDAKRIDKAKRIIRDAAIGLVIVLLAWAIVIFVVGAVSNSTGGTNGSVTPPCNPLIDPGCVILSDDFTLTSVETSHGGMNPADDVMLCSHVQPKFNHAVNPDLTAALGVGLPDAPLQVVKNPTTPGDPSETEVTGTFTAASNAIVFKHPALFDASTDYALRVPQAQLLDGYGWALLFCTALGCQDKGAYVEWKFHVGTKNDVEAPTIISAYPQLLGTPGYPDKNVSLLPVLSVKFSESIDMTTVQDVSGHPIPTNVWVEEWSGNPGIPTSTKTVLSKDLWTVMATPNGFNLGLVSPNLLKAFTWYRINVLNVEDLCSNKMGAGVSWDFETNNSVPGISSRYPEGSNQCPSTEIMFAFGTTMWAHRVQLEITGPGVSITMVRNPNTNGPISGPPGTLEILDTDLIPNNHYTLFRFTPSASLPTNSAFDVTVSSDTLKVNETDTFTESWQFATTTADKCACKPTVLGFSPDQGPRKQCLTVIGACFTGTPAHPADNSKLKLEYSLSTPPAFASPVLDPNVGGIAANAITTMLPGDFVEDDRPHARVSITYQDPAFGTVTSNPSTKDFFVNSSEVSEGPCLFSLQPNAGYTGSPVSALGVRFGSDDPPNTKLTFSGGADASYSLWSDTKINATVPTTAISGLVRASNVKGDSNGVPFTVLIPPPGVPVVTGVWPSCDKACVNAAAGAKFSLAVNASTVTAAGNVTVQRCNNPTCDTFSGPVGVSVAYNSSQKQVDINPTGVPAAFPADSWIRVVLKGITGSGSPPTGGAALGGLNYASAGSGPIDAYSWTFHTKPAPDNFCLVSNLTAQPLATTLNAAGQSVNITSQAFSKPDSCSAYGQMINPTTLGWTWTKTYAPDPNAVTLVPTLNVGTVTAVAETLAPPGAADIDVTATQTGPGVSQSVSLFPAATVRVDFAYCDETTDCTKVGICPLSSCNNILKRCTPVVTSLAPNHGTAGNIDNVNGCYFGNWYDPANSKVTYTSGKVAGFPAVCGSPAGLWTDTSVKVEVPVGTVDGPVKVTRYDGTVSVPNSPGDTFDEDGKVLPGLCSITPTSGNEGSTVTLKGNNFGATQGGGDGVRFTSNQPSGSYSLWTDTQIQCTVPVGAVSGDVVVYKGMDVSGPVTFSVKPAACSICTVNHEHQCAAPASSSCGTDGCCAPRPNLVVGSESPTAGAINVCRNTAVAATFDRDLAPSSANGTNLVVLRTKTATGAGPQSINGSDMFYDSPTATQAPCDVKTATFIESCSYREFMTFNAMGGLGQQVNFQGGSAVLSLTAQNDSNTLYQAVEFDLPFTVEVWLDLVWNDAKPDTLVGTFQQPATRDPYTGYVTLSNVPNGPKTVWLKWTSDWTYQGNSVLGDVNLRILNLTAYPSGQVVPGNVSLDASKHTVQFAPSGLLAQNAPHTVRVRGAQVRYGLQGVEGSPYLKLYSATPGSSTLDHTWSFTTANDPGGCSIASVTITSTILDAGGQVLIVPPSVALSETVTAHPKAANGNTIIPFPGYDWTWEWKTVLGGATVPGGTLPSSNPNAAVTLDGTKPGPATISATATDTKSVKTTGTGSYQIVSCGAADGWAFADTAGNCTSAGICRNLNFDTYYCKSGAVPSDLAHRVIVPTKNACSGSENSQVGCEVKEYFFKTSSTAHDAIGIKVFPNSILKLSPLGWLQRQFGKSKTGSPTTVDGYPAVQDGNTLYVSVPNLDSGQLYANIFVLSYNPDASAETKSIWDQFIKNLRFTTNVSSLERPALRADTERVGELSDISTAIQAKGTPYPTLIAGSYLPGFSTSAWPSWQQTLGAALGTTLPVDSVNAFGGTCPAGFAADTCWKESTRDFQCLLGAEVYGYRKFSTTTELYAGLQYGGTGTWAGYSGDPCAGLGGMMTACECFNYRITVP